MSSFNISDAKTEKNRRFRALMHVVNAVVVSFIFMTLLHITADFFKIDPNLRVRDMDGEVVFWSLTLMLISIVTLFGLSLILLGKIFEKLKI